jgi:UDP-2-acetamido-3-amino-2,3-dideoxy-glucuronate N-acetyltransferase
MIHPKAHIDPDVVLGLNTRVWQFASVIRAAKVGEACNIASCAIVDAATLGDGCLIGHGAQVHPGSKLGRDVFLGPGAVITNDRWPSTEKAGWEFPERGRHTVVIEDGASIGANAVILSGVTIGAGAVIAAGATVYMDIPAGMVWTQDQMFRQKPDDWRYRRMRWVA